MKPRYIFFSLLFISLHLNAQEICNNGVDDDGDSLIDNLDVTDCVCNQIESDVIPNFLPNPSFEEYHNMPNSFNDMNFCKDWFQATTATSDYHHHDGFNFGQPISPPPYGEGFVGFYVYENWLEYVGTHLSTPLLAGTSYTFKCKIAAHPILYGELVPGATGNMSNTSINITIYGHPGNYTYPIPTVQSPPEGDNSWVPLGQVKYIPQPFWSDIQIVFTPPFNVNSVIIGPPKYSNLPANFEGSFMAQGSGPTSPYFFMDYTVLSSTATFNNYNMEVNEHCDMLIATAGNSSSNYFWNNGTMNDTLVLSSPGDYVVTAIDTNGCTDIDTVHVADLFEASVNTSCATNVVTLSVNSNRPIYSYDWDFPTGTTNSSTTSNPTLRFTLPDTNYFSVIVTTEEGCVDTVNAAINVIQFEEVKIPNVLVHSSLVGNNYFDFNQIMPGLNSCVNHQFLVYDRWGTKVFEASNDKYNPDFDCHSCFQGKTSAGEKLAAGVYYYLFLVEGFEYKGYIHIFD